MVGMTGLEPARSKRRSAPNRDDFQLSFYTPKLVPLAEFTTTLATMHISLLESAVVMSWTLQNPYAERYKLVVLTGIEPALKPYQDSVGPLN